MILENIALARKILHSVSYSMQSILYKYVGKLITFISRMITIFWHEILSPQFYSFPANQHWIWVYVLLIYPVFVPFILHGKAVQICNCFYTRKNLNLLCICKTFLCKNFKVFDLCLCLWLYIYLFLFLFLFLMYFSPLIFFLTLYSQPMSEKGHGILALGQSFSTCAFTWNETIKMNDKTI